jgi:hypothetical protein
MSATWNAPANARRMLRWTTLAGLLAATVALGATPAAAHDDNDWYWRHHRHGGYDNDGGYRYYHRERPRYDYRERGYYYQPAPRYYYAPPAYYYAPPPRYYDPSFSFGITIPIH